MTILPVLLLSASLAATPVEPAELAKAQAALESYLTRIEALQVAYTDTWKTADPSRYKREHGEPAPTFSNECELLYSYPSLRLKNFEHLTHADGTIKEMNSITYFHKGKSTFVADDSKQITVKSSSDPIPIPKLPIDPLGLRVLHTMDTPVSDFLKFPEITFSEGDDEIEGSRVVVLKVGPNLPESVRPSAWNDEAYLRLWLAPEQNWLPLRTEIFVNIKTKGVLRWRLSLGSFRPVQDNVRKNAISFPYTLEYEDPYSINTFTVHNVVVNPSFSDGDFLVSPPVGYSVRVDGKKKTLSGGNAERRRRVQQTVEEAKQLLGSVDPPRKSQQNGWIVYRRFGATSLAVLVVSLFFLIRWRQKK